MQQPVLKEQHQQSHEFNHGRLVVCAKGNSVLNVNERDGHKRGLNKEIERIKENPTYNLLL